MLTTRKLFIYLNILFLASTTWAYAIDTPIVSSTGAPVACNADVPLVVRPNGTGLFPSGTTYQWFKEGGILLGATSYTYNADEPGNYSVKVVQGNETVTSSSFWVGTCEGIMELLIDKIDGSIEANRLVNSGNGIVNTFIVSDLATRWEKEWFIQLGQGTTTESEMAFTLPASNTTKPSNFRLIYRESLSSDYEIVYDGIGTAPLLPVVVNKSQIRFSLSENGPLNGLATGYYTLGIVSVASAQYDPEADDLLSYEGFDSDGGSGFGWSGEWSNEADPPSSGYAIVAAETNPLNFDPNPGNYFSLGQTGGYFRLNALVRTSRDFDDVSFERYLDVDKIGKDGTTLWGSFLFRKENDNDQKGYVSLHLDPVTGSDLGTTISIGYLSDNLDNKRYLGLKLKDGTEVKSTQELVVGQNYFLVVKMEFGSTDKVTVYVNPRSFGMHSPEYCQEKLVATAVGDIGFRHFLFYGGGSANQSALDEVRWGTTFRSVTPYVAPSEPQDNYNYIRTAVAFKAVKERSEFDNLKPEEVSISTDYYDEFGKVIQTVQKNAASDLTDIVIRTEYDAQDRIIKSHLPFSVGTAAGGFVNVSSYFNQQDGSYKVLGYSSDYSNDPAVLNPSVKQVYSEPFFAETVYEDSPFDQIKEQASPGDAWKVGGHTHKMQTLVNSANEVLLFLFDDVTFNASARLTETELRYYTEGDLIVTENQEENGTMTRKYTDEQGLLVYTKTVDANNANPLETYYIYDTFGRLRYTLPAKAVQELSSNNWDISYQDNFSKLWAHAYKYDAKGRLCESDQPGADPVKMVYDKLGRLTMKQDGVQHGAGKWSVTKYDEWGRILITGEASLSETAEELQTMADEATIFNEATENSSHNFGYTNNVSPAISNVRLVNYYDDYDFDNDGDDDHHYVYAGLGEEEPVKTDLTNGMPTGSLTQYGTDYLTSVTFYDKYGKGIQLQSNNHTHLSSLGDIKTSVFDFVGRLLKIKQMHIPGGTYGVPVTLQKRHIFDHTGKKLKTYGILNDEPEILYEELKYTRMGDLKEKNIHSIDNGRTFWQSIDYRYNTRGWPISINNSQLANDGLTNDDANDFFGQELLYENAMAGLSSTPCFNGNISAQIWKTVKPDNTDAMAYSYSYDHMNRLKTASFSEKANGIWLATDRNKEEVPQYDANGNIVSLKRTNNVLNGEEIDNLSYAYSGNQLLSVEDAAPNSGGYTDSHTGIDYTYDPNGNQTAMLNKGINAVSYDFANLPTQFAIDNNHWQTRLYAANGTLHRRISSENGVPNTVTTDFVDQFVYKDNALAYIFIENGRIVPNGQQGYKYEYDIFDHVGNVRVTFGTDEMNPTSCQVLQAQHYYPFGGRLSASFYYQFSTEKKWQFGGKEIQREGNLDLNLLDFWARHYDPFVGRWNSVDNVVSNHTPYGYVLNNPITYNDPDGNRESNPFIANQRRAEYNYSLRLSYMLNPALQMLDEWKKQCAQDLKDYYLADIKRYTPYGDRGAHSSSSGGGFFERSFDLFSKSIVGVAKIGVHFTPLPSAYYSVKALMKKDFAGFVGHGVAAAVDLGALKGLTHGVTTTRLYRSVSIGELNSIKARGFSMAEGSYETTKLFATSMNDATNYGRLFQKFDPQEFHIVSGDLPNRHLSQSTITPMDRMKGVAVPANALADMQNIKIYNYTSLPNHPNVKPSYSQIPFNQYNGTQMSSYSFYYVPQPPAYVAPVYKYW